MSPLPRKFNEMNWKWPLFEGPIVWPDDPGRFGAVRKHDIHTGVDLYTFPGMPVIACESGIVVAIEDYTGSKAGTPWWNDTQSILVEGDSGVICYGEISVNHKLQIGSIVKKEDFLGCVQTVLRKNKGRPMSMLHIELYTPGTKESVVWNIGEKQPSVLLDVTNSIRKAYNNCCNGSKLEYTGKGSLEDLISSKEIAFTKSLTP